MNPQSTERSGLNLPPPVTEQVVVPEQPPLAGQSTPEMAPAAAEQGAGLVQPPPAVLQTIGLPQQPIGGASASQTGVSKTTNIVVPDVADDGDLIEKEWVNKAKKIIEDTRDDPRKQNSELTVFKADYMQKRYNKTIQVSE